LCISSGAGMDPNDIRPGVIITGPKWPEPVEVKKAENDGSYIHIVGATVVTGQHVDQLIPTVELSDISIKTITTDFKGDSSKVFLALETKRYRFASIYDFRQTETDKRKSNRSMGSHPSTN